MSRMETELKVIFKQNVDLISRLGVERNRNHLRRKAILESADEARRGETRGSGGSPISK